MCQTCGNRMHKRPISSQPSTLSPCHIHLFKTWFFGWIPLLSLSASWLPWRHIEESQQVRGSKRSSGGSWTHTLGCRLPSAGTFTVTQSTVSRHRSHFYSSHTSLQSLLCTLSGYFVPLPQLQNLFITSRSPSEEEPAHIWYPECEALSREDKQSIWSIKKAIDENGERWMRKRKRGEGSERGMEDYHGPCCPPGSVWHQFEPSCQWVLIMEDWQHCVAAGS